MHSRHFLPALSLLAFCALSALTAPARAESPFATMRYEITFSDGWQSLPSLAGNDSTLALMYGYSMMGYCFLSAGPEGGDSLAASAQFDAFRKSFAGSDSVAKAAEGSATLGGRNFSMIEFKSTDSSETDTRFRYYSMTEGSLRFTAALIYDGNAGSVLVPDFETALGTLAFPGVPIRAWAAPSVPARVRFGRDILGRNLPGAARTAAFFPPAR
jgi:hypothetical protein